MNRNPSGRWFFSFWKAWRIAWIQGPADGVHDEPDVGLHAADFDVGLIRNKDVARMIIVMVHEGFHTDGGCFTVIRDLLA